MQQVRSVAPTRPLRCSRDCRPRCPPPSRACAVQHGQASRVDSILPLTVQARVPPPFCVRRTTSCRHVAVTRCTLVSFLVLLRHLVWMHGLQCAPPPQPPGTPAWVFDGTQVCLPRRHAYVSGRQHTQIPVADTEHVTRGSAFRGRLLIAHPRHRAALRSLVHATHVPCTDDIVSLVQWLQCDDMGGGWRLRPYILLSWVRLNVLACSAWCCIVSAA